MYKVLLIDDEEAILEGLKVLIEWEALGFSIAGEAFDGEEGLAAAFSLCPDVIVTDISMPALNGLELIEKARNGLPGCKLILLSGYANFEYAQRAIGLGAFAYLLKPVSRKELSETLLRAKNELEQAAFSNLEHTFIGIGDMAGDTGSEADSSPPDPPSAPFQPVPLLQALHAQVEDCDREKASGTLDMILNSFTNRRGISTERFFCDCLTILTVLRTVSFEHSLDGSSILPEECFSLEYFRRFSSWNELRGWLHQAVETTIDAILSKSGGVAENLVDSIKQHIDKYYATVSRESIAGAFYMNPSYLSSIFKQYAGVRLTDYITDTRVKKAKHLLRHTNMRINEIAEQVGYQNGQYFAKVFEKHEHISPDRKSVV